VGAQEQRVRERTTGHEDAFPDAAGGRLEHFQRAGQPLGIPGQAGRGQVGVEQLGTRLGT